MRFAVAYMVFVTMVSSLVGWVASANGVLIRSEQGSYIAFGFEAFQHVAVMGFVMMTIIGVISAVLIFLLSWAVDR